MSDSNLISRAQNNDISGVQLFSIQGNLVGAVVVAEPVFEFIACGENIYFHVLPAHIAVVGSYLYGSLTGRVLPSDDVRPLAERIFLVGRCYLQVSDGRNWFCLRCFDDGFTVAGRRHGRSAFGYMGLLDKGSARGGRTLDGCCRLCRLAGVDYLKQHQ